MEWTLQNWVWILFAVGMVAMHLFGHGGHGGHGSQCGPGGHSHADSKENESTAKRSVNHDTSGHQH